MVNWNTVKIKDKEWFNWIKTITNENDYEVENAREGNYQRIKTSLGPRDILLITGAPASKIKRSWNKESRFPKETGR